MRMLALSLFTASFAFAAVAQETVPAGAIIVDGAPTAAIVKKKPGNFVPELEEIGFDPKVKRDPLGNIIDPNKLKSDTAARESTKLRNDSSNSMRSDLRKPTPATPVAADPIITSVKSQKTTTTVQPGSPVPNTVTTTTTNTVGQPASQQPRPPVLP